MKKFLIIASCCVLALIVAFVGAGMYLKANMKDITGRTLGFQLEMSDLDVQYFPPAIKVKGLALEKGGNSVKVSSLKLYPDLTKLLSGKIFLKEAVVDQPSVISDALVKSEKAVSEKRSEAFSPASFPAKKVQINQGVFSLTGPGGLLLPVAVTGQMETTAGGIAVDLKSAVIDELGFKFSGKILVASIAPLVLKVKSDEGTFNPAAVIDFLIKFGYLDNQTAGNIPRIKSIQAKGISLSLDKTPETEGISASLDSIALDQTVISGLKADLKKEGVFELGVGQVVMDVGSIYGWISENPAAKDQLEKTLAQAKLKTVAPQGNIVLNAVSLSGNQKEPQKVNGSLDLKANGLVLKLVSEKGEEQQFTVKELESKITVKEGKPSLQISSFQVEPKAGGTGRVSGKVSFPVDIKALELKAAASDFKAFDATLNLNLEKPKGSRLSFDLALVSPSLTLLAKGMAQEPIKKKLDLEARFDHLKIMRETPSEQERPKTSKADKPSPFDLTVINGKRFSAEAVVRSFQFNDFPQVSNIRFDVKLENDKAIVSGNLTLCNINLALDALMVSPSMVATQVEGKAINVDLTSLVACFSETLPVFLTGRVSFSANLFARGNDPDSMLEEADGDFTVTVNGCGVKRLRNLDYRLSFFLDMLSVAGMDPGGLDSIDFSKASARANLQKGRVVFNSFSITGPLMSAWGKGEYTLKDKRLRISGQVKAGFGLTKALEIDKVLVKQEA